jgi:hypothetical protein
MQTGSQLRKWLDEQMKDVVLVSVNLSCRDLLSFDSHMMLPRRYKHLTNMTPSNKGAHTILRSFHPSVCALLQRLHYTR